MSAWQRGYETREDGQLYGQHFPISLFVYVHLQVDDIILRGQTISISAAAGAFDDLLRSSGIQTAAFSTSTSGGGGTIPPFVNESRVKAGGWFDDSVITDATTVYYGAHPPAGVATTPPFYYSTGTNAFANFGLALAEFNGSGPRRFLIAKGVDLTIDSIVFSRADGGTSPPLPCMLGSYTDPVTGSTQRPILRLKTFYVSGSGTNPLHVQGLHIINTARTYDPYYDAMVSLAGPDSTSCQDCHFERGASVGAGWIDRCIFVANGTGADEKGQGAPIASDPGNVRLITQCVFAGDGLNSHLCYGLGGHRPSSPSDPQSRMEMFDLVAVNCGLSDLGRARNWSAYRATCRLVGDKTGNGYLLGANSPFDSSDWSYTPASGTSPPYLSLTLSKPTDSNEIYPGGFVMIRPRASSPTWPLQNILVSAITFPTSPDAIKLELDADIKDSSNANVTYPVSSVNARYGAPTRTRNENHRHLLNMRTGYVASVQPGIQILFSLMPGAVDFDGYWMYDSIGVAPYGAGALVSAVKPGVKNTSDGGPDFLDLALEHLTCARMPFALVDAQDLSPDYLTQTSPPVQEKLRLEWSISDRSTTIGSQNAGHYYITELLASKTFGTDQHGGRITADRNVYASADGSTNGFNIIGWGGAWSNWQGTGGSGQWGFDPNSILLSSGVQFAGVPTSTTPPYTLDNYDNIRGSVPWGESGTTGSLSRFVNAITSRPSGSWSETVSASVITRALLTAYMPTDRTGWQDAVSSVQFPIGACDYTIPAPSSVSADVDGDDTYPTIVYGITWDRPSGRMDVVRYVIEMYIGTASSPSLTKELWSQAATGIRTTFTFDVGMSYTVKVYSSDGWNRSIASASVTFTA